MQFVGWLAIGIGIFSLWGALTGRNPWDEFTALISGSPEPPRQRLAF